MRQWRPSRGWIVALVIVAVILVGWIGAGGAITTGLVGP
jgi:hypothetical protein